MVLKKTSIKEKIYFLYYRIRHRKAFKKFKDKDGFIY